MLEWVKELMNYMVFDMISLNKICVLIGVFCNNNLVNFYNEDGSGYVFLVD